MSTTIQKYFHLGVLCLIATLLIGLQLKPEAWALFITAILLLTFAQKLFSKEFIIIYCSLGLLGITEITTEISLIHMLQMGSILVLAILLSYVLDKYVLKTKSLSISATKRNWGVIFWSYLIFTVVIAYFLLPFYLKNTGAYLNWSVELDTISIFKLFLGTNALGIWDELFFINIVLRILQRHFSFMVANTAQAILFTSFLYELGFTGWGPLMIYIFAFSQGILFQKTESLLQVIIIHLSLDFILFLALINAHHPELVNIFLF